MIKVCVTGNFGFIGKRLQRTLEKHGNIVIGVDEWIFSREPWRDKLVGYLDKISPEVVFHVGACSDTSAKDVGMVMERNFESTVILTDWCKRSGTPIIYSSSAAVTGNSGAPENLYAWGKLIGERYCVSHGGVALRYFNVYGPGEEDKGKMASVAYQMFIKNTKGEKITLFPKKPQRDFVYIKDIISANIHALENYKELGSKYYEVGSGTARTFEDVLNNMGIEYDYTSEDVIPNGYQFYTCSDKSKWMNGWESKWDLEIGIKDYKEYLEKK